MQIHITARAHSLGLQSLPLAPYTLAARTDGLALALLRGEQPPSAVAHLRTLGGEWATVLTSADPLIGEVIRNVRHHLRRWEATPIRQWAAPIPLAGERAGGSEGVIGVALREHLAGLDRDDPVAWGALTEAGVWHSLLTSTLLAAGAPNPTWGTVDRRSRVATVDAALVVLGTGAQWDHGRRYRPAPYTGGPRSRSAAVASWTRAPGAVDSPLRTVRP